MLDTTANAAAMLPHTPPDHRGCHCNPRSGWIVAVTHPQAETWANSNLQRRGYRTYLPRYAARRRDPVLRTLTRIVLAPLWPGYLFVHHDSRDSWRPIYETPGVRTVIKNRDQIQWAKAGAVEAVEALEDTRRCLTPQNAQWRPGSVVRVANGIMAGHGGVITELGTDTALVSLMFLGHLREISLPLDCLETRGDT